MENEQRCICGELIYSEYPQTGKIKIRGHMIILDRYGVAKAVCKNCKMENEVPLVLDREQHAALKASAAAQKVYVRRSPHTPVIVRKKLIDSEKS